MPQTKTIAIIGAGQAGAQAAQSLRQGGYDGRVILIGDEPHAPYQRPPLSKKFLAGELGAGRLALLPEQFFKDNAIDCEFGVRITGLDVSAKSLSVADGRTIAFDKALLTTGSRSRTLPIPGIDLDGVYSLRTIADADRIRPYLEGRRRLIIIGAGYIGLEVAAIMRGLGLEVRMIEAADRVMARTAPEAVSKHFQALHEANGVSFELGAGVEAISIPAAGELAVSTSAGARFADCVLIGIGGVPNDELAADAGLATGNGIIVDDHCRTSVPHVFAAGDCCNFPSARYGRRVRLESVQNAIDQAKAAALAMLGKGEPYDPVPWFWSDQYDTKFQIAGLSQGADETVLRGDPVTGSFAVAHLLGGRLIALDAINRPRDYMHARRLIAAGAHCERTALADPDTPLDQTVEGRSGDGV